MILPDINLLIYAVDELNPAHKKANTWWNETLSSASTVGLCYPTILGFVRLATNRQVFNRPYEIKEAIRLVGSWLNQPNATIVLPTNRHWLILRSLLEGTGAAGNLTTDAHIAALAIEHGYTVYSNDTDFARFPKLHWVNPLDQVPANQT